MFNGLPVLVRQCLCFWGLPVPELLLCLLHVAQACYEVLCCKWTLILRD